MLTSRFAKCVASSLLIVFIFAVAAMAFYGPVDVIKGKTDLKGLPFTLTFTNNEASASIVLSFTKAQAALLKSVSLTNGVGEDALKNRKSKLTLYVPIDVHHSEDGSAMASLSIPIELAKTSTVWADCLAEDHGGDIFIIHCNSFLDLPKTTSK